MFLLLWAYLGWRFLAVQSSEAQRLAADRGSLEKSTYFLAGPTRIVSDGARLWPRVLAVCNHPVSTEPPTWF